MNLYSKILKSLYQRGVAIANKSKDNFICIECGYESSVWRGQCPNCNSWNSFQSKKDILEKKDILDLENLTYVEEERLLFDLKDLNDIFGGGVVKGSVTLLSGEPGIGKSTLALQMADQIASKYQDVLYISSEESANQVASRAKRLKLNEKKIKIISCSDLKKILKALKNHNFSMIVIDSIQMLYDSEGNSTLGSLSQIKQCASKINLFSKESNIPFLLIGHINKEGSIAGPKFIEHLVDSVLFFQGDRSSAIRTLRSLKNRFGSTNELVIFEMKEEGLIKPKNLSQLILQNSDLSGTTFCITIEGSRPLLVQVESLVNQSFKTSPTRLSHGINFNHFMLIIAILEKHLSIKMYDKDIYLNITGGITTEDRGIDLAIAASLISSYYDIMIPKSTIFIGECSLSGEIRNVYQIEKRLNEAVKLGIENAFISSVEMNFKNINLYKIKNLKNLMDWIKKWKIQYSKEKIG
ncbi:DNA repair protein RadA [Thermodesulfobium acidiphilum]|uniref:DNA repair protein RadA n=1 Tax=Thermodesulfobium acidiphilum TaxID=1794699 RepID=A0A2R4VZ26_THEAF|nr:DNA repair protein RadA [Thermodesulfobium acidiphilum]